MNPFDHLGIPRGSDAATIRAAFRKLAKTVHPDHHQGRPEFVERFRTLQEAYEKALLDASSTPSNPEFGAGATGGRRRPAAAFRTVYRDVVIDVAQAMAGTTVSIEGAAGICKGCEGTGRLPSDRPVSCVTCSGTGVGNVQSKGYISVRLQCSECDGTGMTTETHCHHCGGFGVSSTQPCEVAIPRNVRSGDAFKIEGAASIPQENVRGDVEVLVTIRDPRYAIAGDDVEATVWLDLWQALRGGTTSVRLPDGTAVRLTYPAGTVPGRRFTMKGKGLEALDDGPPGNFVAIASIRPIDRITPEVASALGALERAVEAART